MSAGSLEVASGQELGGRFRVLHALSAGGMGSVHVAEQLKTGRKRALKVMHPELARDPKFRDRFEREAMVGARIKSDHIVEVVDAGVDEATGAPWLAMELLEGADLADVLTERGPLPREMVGAIFEQLCHALSAAHDAEIVHRDLKPENLFLATSNRADSDFTLKVLDFGIAKVVSEANTKVTQSIGSPLWMAPEQTIPGEPVTYRTDVWALGLIAFALLTGRSYWKSANVDAPVQMMILRELAMEPLVAASVRAKELGFTGALPAGFDAWFARCVVREPDARFASVEDLRARLASVLGGPAGDEDSAGPATDVAVAVPKGMKTEKAAPVLPADPSGQTRPMPSSTTSPETISASPEKRKPTWTWAVAGVVVLGGGGLAAAQWGGDDSSTESLAERTSRSATPMSTASSPRVFEPSGRSSASASASIPAVAPGQTCEAAVAEYREKLRGAASETDPEVVKKIDEKLSQGTYLKSCGVSSRTSVSVCAAIQSGGAVGVTVRTQPQNGVEAGCVKAAVQAMSFPEVETLVKLTAEFEARAAPSPAPRPPAPRPWKNPRPPPPPFTPAGI